MELDQTSSGSTGTEWHCHDVGKKREIGRRSHNSIRCIGVVGMWAIYGPSWFQIRWAGLGSAMERSITVKELIPIVMAAAVWGAGWMGKSVLARCDNAAVVVMVNSRTSKEQEAMHLLRCLAFLEARFSFHVVSAHIRGEDNTLADALSRNNRDLFLSLSPQAHREVAVVPAELLDVLIVTRPDWTSLHWTQMWTGFSEAA